MQTGKIKKLISDRGFGFISNTDGKDLFFHQGGLVDVQFTSLSVDQEVEFEIEQTEKGPRAINVRVKS
jgi:CspA family cold shock protein